MKQIAQNYRSGELALVDVPAPACRPGGVLVRTEYSLVSTGTEMMKIHESRLSLVGKARARPDQVKKVLQTVAQQGPVATYRKVMDRLDSYTPLGYSLAGTIVEVGPGAEPLAVGQRVACAGNQFALHAEYNWVPVNLCVPVPDGVESRHAAFAAVASIALHAMRQAEARLGEVACVIGLGLVGQILVQILNAAGVKVIGLDLDQQRCDLAQASGAVACGPPHEPGLSAVRAAAARLTGGAGCDHLFITAGGRDSGPVELAVSFARDRARVTDVGKCGLDLAWNEWYDKELELRFSRSYGPGRYDPRYEEGGQDYPIGYVRWTEGRNLECVLDLIASGRLDPEPLISVVAPFSDAVSTYEKMNNGALRGLGVLFRYEPEPVPARRLAAPARPRPARARGEVVRLGVIGSGNYASSMLLPHLKEHPGVRLVEVATTRGLTAANAQRKFGFARCSTDYRGLLEDREIDAILIATRHASHARLVCEALAAGKAVFVEKPLAIRPEELAEVAAVVHGTGNDRLMVGFNRRFAPLLARLKESWGPRQGPHVVRYLVNAGPLEHGSWYADAAGEGSRFVGEGCHFIDTISWWLGQDPVSVVAAAGPADPSNVSAILLYPDGSRGEIAYLTEGDRAYPKETFEAFGEGSVARLGNFQRFEMWRGGKARSERALLGIDKGQKNEIEAFVRAVATGGPMPIPFSSLLATTAATFAVERAAATRAPAVVEIEPAAPDPLASDSPSAAAGR